ncbi:MAG TPA: hypothetical protein VIN59_01720 [Alphaproteobacteria bacterium]
MAKSKFVRIREVKDYKPGDLAGEFAGEVITVLDIKDLEDHIVDVAMGPEGLVQGEFFVSDAVIEKAGRDKIEIGDHIAFSHTKDNEPLLKGYEYPRIVRLRFLP